MCSRCPPLHYNVMIMIINTVCIEDCNEVLLGLFLLGKWNIIVVFF